MMDRSTYLKVFAAALLLIGCFSAFAVITYRTVPVSPVLWSFGNMSPPVEFYPSDDGIYLVGLNDVSFLTDNGTISWNRTLEDEIRLSTAGDDGRLYVFTQNKKLQVFDHDRTFTVPGLYNANRHLSAGARGIYLRSGTTITALKPDGQEMWNDTGVISDPVFDDRENVYYLNRHPDSMSDIYLHCRPVDGDSWSTRLDHYNAGTGLVAAADGAVVTGSLSGDLFYICSDGSRSWKYYKPYLGAYRFAMDEQGKIFLVYDKGTVHVLNREGEMIGKFSAESAYDINTTARLTVMNGTVYSAVKTSEMSATVVATGMDGVERWEAYVNCTEPVSLYSSNGTVYAASEILKNGRMTPVLYVFDASGHMVYSIQADDGGRWSDLKISPGHPVYTMTTDGKLYALRDV